MYQSALSGAFHEFSHQRPARILNSGGRPFYRHCGRFTRNNIFWPALQRGAFRGVKFPHAPKMSEALLELLRAFGRILVEALLAFAGGALLDLVLRAVAKR
jgi:hypothetical protein